MKTLLLTLMLFLFNSPLTEIIGKYQIENENSFDTLELKKDGTYKYQSLGDSCWTWTDITGTWELKNGILILNHIYTYQESATTYIESIKPDLDDIIFEVKDNFGKPIQDFEITYWCDNKQIRKTDENGIVGFEKCYQIQDAIEIVSVGIKYLINGYKTGEANQVYKKSNYIVLTINSEPKTINKKEKYRFEYINGKLKSIEFPYVDEMSTYRKL